MLTGLAAAFFYLFAFILVTSAIMVITVRKSIHSVLFLILVFFTAAVLFLLTGAEFLAMILIIVYVGAVAVLFLFVIMMIDINFTTLRHSTLLHISIGALVGLIVLTELIFVFLFRSFFKPEDINLNKEHLSESLVRSNTQMLGDVLYTDYVLYFQLAALILLVAMIGAIVLALQHRKGVKRQSIAQQVARTPEKAIEIKQVEFNKGI